MGQEKMGLLHSIIGGSKWLVKCHGINREVVSIDRFSIALILLSNYNAEHYYHDEFTIRTMGRVKSISLTDEDGFQVNQLLSKNGFLPLRSTVVDLSYKARINGRTFFAKENRRVQKRNSYTASFFSPSSTTPHCRFIERFLVDT